jgi:HAE1 family hydrophobic/amphiphilic exporter-1
MHGYLNWSHALLRKAVIGVVIIGGFTVADAFIGRTMPTGFLPEEDYGYAMLHVQLPPAASLERTDQVMKKVENVLAHTDGVQYYTGIGGFSLLNRISASYQAFFFMSLKPWDERTSKELKAQAILAKINGALATQIPEGWLSLSCRHRFLVSVGRRFLTVDTRSKWWLSRIPRSKREGLSCRRA